MKKLFVFLLFLTPLICNAQKEVSITNRKNDYCVMTPQQWGKQVNISLDLGDKVPDSKNTILKDAQGKNMKFNSVADALNYMEDEGWTLVSTYNKTYKSFDGDVIFIYKRPHKNDTPPARTNR